MTGRGGQQAARRVLSLLVKGDALMSDGVRPGCRLLEAGDGVTIGVEEVVFDDLVRQGFVRLKAGRASITASGRLHVTRQKDARVDALKTQPVETESAIMATAAGPEAVTVNAAESPLAQLSRRKGRDGQPFLCPREFEAGERLRADYGRGLIVPRTGMNWSFIGVSASSGRRGAAYVELSDAALAARRRVELALDAVGPELAGVLVDVCCFLKGLERVEAERGWPVRSAKIVLKSALAALARHYNPVERGQGRSHRPVLHWGTEDYRPRIAG